MAASILVVEDDLNLLHIVSETLEDEDYVVERASSVSEALALAKQFKFDLVLSDIRMAHIDGVEGVVRLKKYSPDLRCIVMTGYVVPDAQERSMAVQVDDYLKKPFPLDHLLYVVRRVLRTDDRTYYYFGLLKKLSTKILSFDFNLFRQKREAELRESRRRAFQALYIGIRSDYLDLKSSNSVCSKLEQIEKAHVDYLVSPCDEMTQKLKSDYDWVYNITRALQRPENRKLLRERNIPKDEMEPLFEAVRRADITLDELEIVLNLRAADDSKVSSDPELHRLQSIVWGQKGSV